MSPSVDHYQDMCTTLESTGHISYHYLLRPYDQSVFYRWWSRADLERRFWRTTPTRRTLQRHRQSWSVTKVFRATNYSNVGVELRGARQARLKISLATGLHRRRRQQPFSLNWSWKSSLNSRPRWTCRRRETRWCRRVELSAAWSSGGRSSSSSIAASRCKTFLIPGNFVTSRCCFLLYL